MEDKSKESAHSFEVRHIFNKHMQFAMGPMEGKSVRTLPGIEEVLGARLEALGYTLASQLYEQYLAVKKDKFRFQYWMERLCSACYVDSANVYYALQAWDQSHSS